MHHHLLVRKIFLYILPAVVVFFILGGITVYELIKISTLEKKVASLSLELASTTQTLSDNTLALSKNFVELSRETVGITKTLNHTQQNIDVVKTQVGGVEQTVGSISGAVGSLQKLAQIDPQLLKKYSKVYFMNENYTPAHLTIIPKDNTYNSMRQEQFLNEAMPHLTQLLSAATTSGITLYVKSAYRSFAEQKTLKSSYSVIYGAGTANAFSADQGYSEHQLGTTIDFITTGLGGNLNGFDKTEAYTWLSNNAYKYGFILSYPKGNNYYIYEPWHWRYVGLKLATYLHSKSMNFYDLDQREIDTYLINTFD